MREKGVGGGEKKRKGERYRRERSSFPPSSLRPSERESGGRRGGKGHFYDLYGHSPPVAEGEKREKKGGGKGGRGGKAGQLLYFLVVIYLSVVPLGGKKGGREKKEKEKRKGGGRTPLSGIASLSEGVGGREKGGRGER